ncbi:MAG: right-handed parallel beta-helix repeat-containing protein, partial [Hyphomicrobiales bacterium]
MPAERRVLRRRIHAVLVWRNASDVTVHGGYDATAGGGNDPGPRTGEATVIQRKLGNGIRVMTLAGVSNCTIEQVTFRDGSDPAGGGHGVYLTNCWDVTFAGCVVSNNGGGAFSACGLGLLLNRSSAVLTNTTIANNVIRGLAWGCVGGGIYIDSASRLTAIRSS